MQTTKMSRVQQEIWSAFRRSPAWNAASDPSLAALIAGSRVRCIAKGQCVFFDGDPGDHMAFVISGHLRAISNNGGRRLTTSTAWAGETIGLQLVIAESPYQCDVEAGERSVVAIVPSKALLELMQAEPGVQMSLLEIAAKQAIDLSHRLATMSLDTTSRVAGFVLDRLSESRLPGRRLEADLRVSRVELADMLGTAPETLSRSFTQLRDRGLIASDGGHCVTVVDPGALASVAAGC